jgi:hypothetical protein
MEWVGGLLSQQKVGALRPTPRMLQMVPSSIYFGPVTGMQTLVPIGTEGSGELCNAPAEPRNLDCLDQDSADDGDVSRRRVAGDA